MVISEQFRLLAKDYVDKESAASLLEELKSATLSQRMTELGDMPVSRAEMTVKASQEWREFIEAMVTARKAANEAKLKLEWIRLRHSERMSEEANARAERKL